MARLLGTLDSLLLLKDKKRLLTYKGVACNAALIRTHALLNSQILAVDKYKCVLIPQRFLRLDSRAPN